MSYKGKTYSKKGGGGKGNPFERMMKEQCNKPVAAKSAGIVGKWGTTSFTSVRTGDPPSQPNPGAPRVKKFFKSRTQENSDSSDLPSSGDPPLVTVSSASLLPSPLSLASSLASLPPAREQLPPAKKFFKGSRAEAMEEPLSKPPASRPRGRPAQRSDPATSPRPVPRSPLQGRSPLQARSPLQVKSPQQETSPQSPLPLARVARRPPGPSQAFVTPPLISPPESGSDPFDSVVKPKVSKRAGKRKHEDLRHDDLSDRVVVSKKKYEDLSIDDVPPPVIVSRKYEDLSIDDVPPPVIVSKKKPEDSRPIEVAAPLPLVQKANSDLSLDPAPAAQPPLKLKLSLTKSPVKGGPQEFSVVGKAKERAHSPTVAPPKKRGRPPGVPSPVPPPLAPPNPPVVKKSAKKPPTEPVQPSSAQSPVEPLPSIPTGKKKVKKSPVEYVEPPRAISPVFDHTPPSPPIMKKSVKKPAMDHMELPFDPQPVFDHTPPSPPIVKKKNRKVPTEYVMPHIEPSPVFDHTPPSPPFVKKKNRKPAMEYVEPAIEPSPVFDHTPDDLPRVKKKNRKAPKEHTEPSIEPNPVFDHRPPSPLVFKKKNKKAPMEYVEPPLEPSPVFDHTPPSPPLVKKRNRKPPMDYTEAPTEPFPAFDHTPPSPPLVKKKSKKNPMEQGDLIKASNPSFSEPPLSLPAVKKAKKPQEEPQMEYVVPTTAPIPVFDHAPPSPPVVKKKTKKLPVEPPRAPSPVSVPRPPSPTTAKQKVKKPPGESVKPPRELSPAPRQPSPQPAAKKVSLKKVKRPAEFEDHPEEVVFPTGKRNVRNAPSPAPPEVLGTPSPVAVNSRVPSPPPRSLSPLPVVKKKGRPKKEIEKALPLPQRKEEIQEVVPQQILEEESIPWPKRKEKVEEEEEALPLPLPHRRGREGALPARKPLSPAQRPASPDLEFSFPARITARDTVTRPAPSGKKSIFKSRSRASPQPTAPAPTPSPAPAPAPAPAPFVEEPRSRASPPPTAPAPVPTLPDPPAPAPTLEAPRLKPRSRVSPASPASAPSLPVPTARATSKEAPRVPLITSSADLFAAWDAEIPSLSSPCPSSPASRTDPASSPPPPAASPPPPPVHRPVTTFFKNRHKEREEPVTRPKDIEEEPALVPVKPKPFVPAPKPSKPAACQLELPGASSPEFKVNFPARIAGPQPASLPSGRVLGQKRSIFKSKSKENTAPPKKALSLYKHKLGWGGEKDAVKSSEESSSQPSTAELLSSYDDSEFEDGPSDSQTDLSFMPSKLTRVATYPGEGTGVNEDGELVTQVKCPKSYKEYYTVIKKVKKAHEMNDLGEYQEFADDVEYIADGMKARNSTAARCLAAVSLAQKCMKSSFRMHLRAHGEVSKFFVELKDAPSNPSLALCTSTILFVLSQDRLNMDMDRDSLELMLNLLDTDCSIKTALEGHGKELAKNKQKVIDICTEMKAAGHAGTLNIALLSADHLAMETLLSMTSKRAGEWFKEELRELGGLGHLARTLSDCVSYLTVKKISSWTQALTDKLKKANRILRVLENVSHENEENCNYLIAYGREEGEEFLEVLQNLFRLLDEEVQLNPTTDMADKEEVGSVLRDTLFSVIRVHINIVHDYRPKANGSLHVGQKQGCVARVLRCLFIMPYWFCPLNKRFEALVLSLTLLINMVEHCEENRQSIMDSMAAQKETDNFCVKEEPRMAVEDLVQLFVDRDTLAKMSEEKTDNILDDVEEEVQEIDQNTGDTKPTLDDTVQKLIGKAGNHMESTLIAAYVGLIIGYLVQGSEDYEQRVREYLPGNDFKGVVEMLHKMYNFMKMTALGTISSSKGLKATDKIIKYLEKIDAEPEEEDEEEASDYTLFNVSADDTTLLDTGPALDNTSFSFEGWGKL